MLGDNLNDDILQTGSGTIKPEVTMKLGDTEGEITTFVGIPTGVSVKQTLQFKVWFIVSRLGHESQPPWSCGRLQCPN